MSYRAHCENQHIENCSTALRVVALQLLVKSAVGMSRGPRHFHLAVCILKRKPLSLHQVADRDGG